MFEENLIIKDWRKIDLTFGLIYPNTYKMGMSSYSIRLLYFMINSNPGYACERFFLPENVKYPASDDNSSINRIRSIENRFLPTEFDILGFSVHYENDFKNILWILEKAQIPLESETRLKDVSRNYPLVIGGGPAITSNPLPLSKVFDLFFIGDAEPNLNDFFEKFLDFKSRNSTNEDFFNKVTKIEGIYIPSLDNPTNRTVLKNLNQSPTPVYQLLSKSDNNKKIFEENYFIEINRGCPFRCKFCLSSFHNYPFRNKSFDEIIKSINNGLKYSNFEKFSLIGSCISSHPRFSEICEFILNSGKHFSIPSLRIEHITPKIIQILERSDIKTITIAPETGNDSLRFDLNKKVSNDSILHAIEMIHKSKIKNIKFYFLIGLPGETDYDILEIVTLLNSIEKLGFTRNQLRVNINPFIPKLNTPYENKCYYYLSENLNILLDRFKTLENELKRLTSIKIKFKNPKRTINAARLQTLISLGDSSISELLLRYYSNGATMGALRRVEKELGFSIDNYFHKIQDGYKPWTI
ncbi:MAG: radical SAM protein [Candidatus Lokiarchaeota archaeon]|nr:radical SAM protein [Candidatus Lokiarchaeota archaeon]